MYFTSIANVWKRRCCTGRVEHCKAPVHHHGIPSVHCQAQFNMVPDYIYKLWVVKVREWCCCAYFAVLYILVCININYYLFTYRLGQWCSKFFSYSPLTNPNTVGSSPTEITEKIFANISHYCEGIIDYYEPNRLLQCQALQLKQLVLAYCRHSHLNQYRCAVFICVE